MGELRPLADDLNDDCRRFAQALRTLFSGLEVSVRSYATLRYRDAGTVSRYLGGTRVPPWKFVVELFADLAAGHGAPATPLTLDHVQELHRFALRSTVPRAAGLRVLHQQLDEAAREARHATVREGVVGDALLDRQHRIADLEVRLTLLETQWTAERTRVDPVLTVESDSADDLRAERALLKAQVERLGDDLEEARLRVLLAESRCAVLERQLVVAVGPLPALPVGPGGPVLKGEPGSGVAELGEGDLGEPGPAGELADAVTVGPAQPLGQVRARILVVDDKQPNLDALEAVLAGLGHDVVTAESGEAALKALLDGTGFAVILLDVQMPDMDGYETALHIKGRARTRNIPIIFLTAMDDDPSHRFRGYTAGAVDYLVKPFDPWIIRAKVEAFAQMYIEARTLP